MTVQCVPIHHHYSVSWMGCLTTPSPPCTLTGCLITPSQKHWQVHHIHSIRVTMLYILTHVTFLAMWCSLSLQFQVNVDKCFSSSKQRFPLENVVVMGERLISNVYFFFFSFEPKQDGPDLGSETCSQFLNHLFFFFFSRHLTTTHKHKKWTLTFWPPEAALNHNTSRWDSWLNLSGNLIKVKIIWLPVSGPSSAQTDRQAESKSHNKVINITIAAVRGKQINK